VVAGCIWAAGGGGWAGFLSCKNRPGGDERASPASTRGVLLILKLLLTSQAPG